MKTIEDLTRIVRNMKINEKSYVKLIDEIKEENRQLKRREGMLEKRMKAIGATMDVAIAEHHLLKEEG